MIDNPHPNVVNIGVHLCLPFMGTFDYPPPFGNVKLILVVPDQPRDDIFQVSSLCTTYFNDLWNLPSPSTTMEGAGNPGMAMPLFIEEVVYSIVQ
jgi:hypothetical protein